ncbi:MAG: glycosyltransferase family 39 protein [Flavobacteriales bacterium]|nr:glycosyltransferase family 39 protein [Flavobacteriales bacterium]
MSSTQHRSRGRRRSSEQVQGSAWARFLHDVRDVKERYLKQTSAAHKRFVLLLITGGAVLRIWCMLLPITADEAVAYMTFAVKPIGETISNYALPSNHVFHTVLTKWSTALFGNNLVALRLPSVLAGVLVLPLFYLFVRSMFNRYIALMALAMAAASPCLVEVSALAHGYSLAWFWWMLALVLGRHVVRENNTLTAVLMGVSCALGMWAVPTMMPMALMVFFWVVFSLLGKYERSVSTRMASVGISLLVFLVLTTLLYFPVILSHGLDQLFHHATEEQYSWKNFSHTYPDRVLDLWVWIVDPTYWWVAALGFVSLTHAAYISVKYRTILIAMVIGAVPLTLILADVGSTHQWAYLLFVFHLGMSIAAFYLLKFVQDKVIKTLGKRTRTAGGALVLFVGFALPGMGVVRERVIHLPEAAACAEHLAQAMRPADRMCMDTFWFAPVAFHLRAHDMDAEQLEGLPAAGGMQFVVVLQPNGQSMEGVLMRCDQRAEAYELPTRVKDWDRMEIFAARLR